MYNSFCGKFRGFFEEHLTLFVCIVFAFAATIVSHLSMTDFVLFIVVQFFCIYIPGLAILRLCRMTLEDAQIRNFVAYALGYSMSIIVYLLLLMVGLQHLSRIISIAMAVVGLFLVWKQRTIVDTPAFLCERYFIATIITLCFLGGMVISQYNNRMSIEDGNNIFVNQDLVFWLRNCVAATKSYPFPELSVMGKDFFYHYFTSVEIAWLHYVTGIEILDLCFTYSYLITLFLFASGTYVVSKAIVMNRRMVYWAVLFILFTSSLEIFTHIFYSLHLFSVSFGLAEGLAISCYSFYFFVRWYRSGFISNIDVIFSALFLMICTGLKGPVAAVVLIGYGVGCVIAIFKNGTFGRGVAAGFAYLFVFVMILALFVFSHEPSIGGSSSELTVSLTDTMFHSHLYEKLNVTLISALPFSPLVYIIVFFSYIFSAMLIPTILFVYAVRRCPSIKGVDLIIMSIVVWGIFLAMFVSQRGMSQMYFMFVSILYLNLLCFSLLSMNNHVTVSHQRFLCGVFVLGFVLYGWQLAPNTIPFVKDTLNSLCGTNFKQIQMEESGFTISKSEIEGLRWVRDHVSENAVLLSNKVLEENGGARCFWVSSLTERQIYFESYDYSNLSENYIKNKKELVARFYNGDKKISSFLKKKGVSYAVVFKNLHYNPSLYSENKNKLVFENRDMFLIKL